MVSEENRFLNLFIYQRFGSVDRGGHHPDKLSKSNKKYG